MEIAQQRKKVSMLGGADRKKDRRDAQIHLSMLEVKLHQSLSMVVNAKVQKRNLDAARVQYKQRLDVRDERKRMLDSIKAKIEKMRLEYDGIGLSPSLSPSTARPARTARTRKKPVPREPSRTTITD